jgi:hypothetical protein
MKSQRSSRVNMKELEIFDFFYIDTNLPKHKKVNDSENHFTVRNDFLVENDFAPSTGGFYGQNMSIKQKIKNWIISKLDSNKKDKKIKRVISIPEFFTSMSKSFEELTSVLDVALYYEKALVQANENGQVALEQKIKDNINIVKYEAQLISIGLTKYVTEKQVIDLFEKVGEDKNLKLTWIKNFNRIIPENVYKIKKDVDSRLIFDNYVILHYDPINNGEKLTKEEIEYKKDPILFGLINNSKKLYYVADWKDDYCDLTLEEMFNTLGENVLEINNKNVKTFIDKI